MEYFVFVYGSLKKGFENHRRLVENDGKYIGKGITKQSTFKMYSVNDFYPALSKGDEKISGEVYKINENCLKELDYLESYPRYYNRDIFLIDCNDQTYGAYIYYIKDIKETFREELPTNSKRIKRENNIASWEK